MHEFEGGAIRYPVLNLPGFSKGNGSGHEANPSVCQFYANPPSGKRGNLTINVPLDGVAVSDVLKGASETVARIMGQAGVVRSDGAQGLNSCFLRRQ